MSDVGVGVVIVEDDPGYREGVALLFSGAPGFRLHAQFGTAEEALQAAGAPGTAVPGGWDLLLVDIGLPGMDGVEVARRLRARLPDARIVMLTVFEDPRSILEAICAGADGYLLKKSAHGQLLEHARTVAAGGALLTGGVATIVLDLLRRAEGGARRGPAIHLSPRERDVLVRLSEGRAYKQVADDLGIGLDTVRTYVRAIYRKLQVNNVAAAVTRALRDRLI